MPRVYTWEELARQQEALGNVAPQPPTVPNISNRAVPPPVPPEAAAYDPKSPLFRWLFGYDKDEAAAAPATAAPAPAVPASSAPAVDPDRAARPVDVTDAAPVVESTPISDILKQKQLIQSIYPSAPTAVSQDQNSADAYAMREKQRANLLSQLALSAGIAKAAGGSWKEVGSGLMAAGAAQAEGFERYQKAMQGMADRTQDRANTEYKSDVATTDAAIKLYSEEQKAGRQAVENNRKLYSDYLKQRGEAVSSGDMPDQEAINKHFDEYMYWLQTGQLPVDVQ